MSDLSAAAMLDLWEAGCSLDPVERSVGLAAAVEAESAREDVARLPLGRRDARLLRLHARLAGSTLDAIAECPSCGAQAEFEVDGAALLDQDREAIEATPVEIDGFHVVWRPPDSRDLAAAAAAGDAEDAERVLLLRCVATARGPDGDLEPGALPALVQEAVSRAMAKADPLAEILVTVTCPVCVATFVADIEVGAFVWTELCARVQGLLHEVDVLARTYGWTENEVLALSEERRAAYLRLAAEGGS
jgi:hypothetical protein